MIKFFYIKQNLQPEGLKAIAYGNAISGNNTLSFSSEGAQSKYSGN